MIEQMIAIFCLIAYFWTRDIEVLKICGIFSIASYLCDIRHKIEGLK